MDSEEFSRKSKEELKKFAEASKNVFEKVGGNIQKFTDDSVVKIERNQLERKRAGKYEELGTKLSALLLDGAKIQGADEEAINSLLAIQEEIENFTQQIKAKEDLLNK